MNLTLISSSLILSVSCFLVGCLGAQETASEDPAQVPEKNRFDEQFEIWPVDLKINGSVILGGLHEKLFAEHVQEVNELAVLMIDAANDNAANDDAASDDAEESGPSPLVVFFFGQFDEPDSGAAQIFIVNADQPVNELANKAIESAELVALIFAGDELPDWLVEQVALLSDPLHQIVARGGTIAAEGEITRLLGSAPHGINLVPDTMIFPGYESETGQEAALELLAEYPRTVGIGIADETTIELRGRKIRVSGNPATFLLSGNEHTPDRVEQIRQSESMRDNPYETVTDLTAWRRDAIERSLDPFPAPEREAPFVAGGTLIIVGGGGMAGTDETFIELAGGKDARLVYVPCAEEETLSREPGILRAWEAAGVASATWIHTKDRTQANSDEEFLKPLKDATGIFFGGGRQWNFSDSYYGTEAHRLMKEVLDRGGVIAGSSAGASIQGRYLARANPVANFDIMAAGYERGLGFISGVAIDQHFSQRGRQPDMESLVARYPQLLGIGIDESTAIIVRGSEAEIVGRGKVWFYDQPAEQNEPCEPVALPAGSRFDLATRTVLSQPDKAEPDGTDEAKSDKSTN